MDTFVKKFNKIFLLPWETKVYINKFSSQKKDFTTQLNFLALRNFSLNEDKIKHVKFDRKYGAIYLGLCGKRDSISILSAS